MTNREIAEAARKLYNTRRGQYAPINPPLVLALIDSMEESLINGESQWSISDDGLRVSITTRYPDNINLSNNGGDYFFDDEYEEIGGHVTKHETTSCDIDFDWGFQTVKYGKGSLAQAFEIARCKVVPPAPLDTHVSPQAQSLYDMSSDDTSIRIARGLLYILSIQSYNGMYQVVIFNNDKITIIGEFEFSPEGIQRALEAFTQVVDYSRAGRYES